ILNLARQPISTPPLKFRHVLEYVRLRAVAKRHCACDVLECAPSSLLQPSGRYVQLSVAPYSNPPTWLRLTDRSLLLVYFCAIKSYEPEPRICTRHEQSSLQARPSRRFRRTNPEWNLTIGAGTRCSAVF